MKLTEFFAEIFFKTNPLPLKDLIKNMGELNARTILAGVGLDKVYDRLKDMTDQAIVAALSLQSFAATTGLSTDAVQQWGAAAEQLGGSAGDIAGDFAKLNNIFIMMRKNQPLPAGMEQAIHTLNQAGAGISAMDMRRPEQFFTKVHEGLKRLSEENKTFVITQLNVSSSMATALRSGDEQFQQMSKNAFMLRDQANMLQGVNKEWKIFDQNVRQAGNTIAAEFAPQLMAMARIMTAVTNTDFFKNKLVPGFGKMISSGLNVNNAFLEAGTHPMRTARELRDMAGKATQSVTNQVSVVINTATDNAKEIAREAEKALENALKNATYQHGGPKI